MTANRPPRLVLLRDLEIMASVGVYEVEHRYEQRVVVNLEIRVRDDYDGVSERLADVLDYSKVAADVEALAGSRHFKLIETFAERVAEVCLVDPRVMSARVRVEKPDILPACKSVGVEIERAR